MINSGKYSEYYWIEIVSDSYNMDSLILLFPEFIIDKYLSIVSFDSDSFVPTDDELQRGWVYEDEIAYFDKVTAFELSQNSLFDIYDQWLLFDTKQRFKSMDIFVNYSGFSIDLNESREMLTLKDTERFWNQIEKIKPQKFILNGDKLIFGTNNRMEFEKVKASCQQLLA
ncbi:hypothetical protein D0809_16250 [Flavobacterium circumlabens]|uniref:Uncharacterized protein n=1 Tax=Flavobacterium circumlabens TaxID=2133765 RepID=A0A4Y7U9S5_9FLAO|nr:hypothetical protein [Flavobacterium circumlabens]TCN55608.1 hypothetical protein EV142_106300 [Flavobacterium circumlabens]TEB42991.1 hypothetical protein D0809_16250 [Flavobacterium circumlabens]